MLLLKHRIEHQIYFFLVYFRNASFVVLNIKRFIKYIAVTIIKCMYPLIRKQRNMLANVYFQCLLFALLEIQWIEVLTHLHTCIYVHMIKHWRIFDN